MKRLTNLLLRLYPKAWREKRRSDLLISTDQGRIGVAFTYRDFAVAKAAVANIGETLNYVIQRDVNRPAIVAYAFELAEPRRRPQPTPFPS
jgi:hypothetical protein